ncbi:hypothetical protein [Bradyrhizobium sp. Leo170]|uniref:hypothetical protein n=1 Tax=Bradyrhizobium sp. Leo170 TaxID=1571199 RepID=UPI00102E2460|nr:hypothetical protein [Bradyrhizobium sp. Leo170]TAI61591.1 hypothetical protein CWO89_34375 [Bradyrhizobium sp. Leo170]
MSDDVIAAQPQSRPLNAKIWSRADDEWYVEPVWCSERLFAEEQFEGSVYDPCCGTGRIVVSALKAGLKAYGSDLVYRGWDSTPQDFLIHRGLHDNIVCNSPFANVQQFAQHALKLARRKVAMIFPVARLNAAHWNQDTPLARIWLLTPRPSMPPGHVILAGEKPGGGKADFCWLVWSRDHVGPAELRWLHRDGGRP